MAKAKTAVIFCIWTMIIVIGWSVFCLLEYDGILTDIFGKQWIGFSALGTLLLAALPIVLRLKYHVSLKKVMLCMIVCLAILSVSSAALHFGTRAYLRVFTAEKWADYPTQREQMLDSLSTTQALVGMNTAQTRSLLGEPDKTNASADLYRISTDDMLYFAIQHNQDGIVTRVYIHRNVASVTPAPYRIK